MRRPAAIAFTCWFMFLGQWLCAPAGFGAPWAAPQRPVALCFRHVGPEDKPMAGFCVVAPAPRQGAAPAWTAPADVQTLAPSRPAWCRLLALVNDRAPAAHVRRGVFGEYALRQVPAGAELYLAPETMRDVVAILGQGIGGSQAHEALLATLRRRLGG